MIIKRSSDGSRVYMFRDLWFYTWLWLFCTALWTVIQICARFDISMERAAWSFAAVFINIGIFGFSLLEVHVVEHNAFTNRVNYWSRNVLREMCCRRPLNARSVFGHDVVNATLNSRTIFFRLNWSDMEWRIISDEIGICIFRAFVRACSNIENHRHFPKCLFPTRDVTTLSTPSIRPWGFAFSSLLRKQKSTTSPTSAEETAEGAAFAEGDNAIWSYVIPSPWWLRSFREMGFWLPTCVQPCNNVPGWKCCEVLWKILAGFVLFLSSVICLFGAIVFINLVISAYTWAWDSLTYIWRYCWYVVPIVTTCVTIIILLTIFLFRLELRVSVLHGIEVLEIRRKFLFLTVSRYIPLTQLTGIKIVTKDTFPNWIEFDYGPNAWTYLVPFPVRNWDVGKRICTTIQEMQSCVADREEYCCYVEHVGEAGKKLMGPNWPAELTAEITDFVITLTREERKSIHGRVMQGDETENLEVVCCG